MKSAVNALIEVGSQASDVVKVGKAVHDVCITGNNTSVGAEEVGEHAKAMSESRAETVKDLLDKRNSNQPIDKVPDEGVPVVDGVQLEDGIYEGLTTCEAAEKAGGACAFGQAAEATNDAVSEIAGAGAKAVHQVTRVVGSAVRVAPRGVPAIKNGKEQLKEGLEAVEPLGEAVVSAGEAVVDAVGEEILEATLEVVPIVGTAIPAANMVFGTGAVIAGFGGLAYAGIIECSGAKEKAKRVAAWSASISAEGSFVAAKGVVGLVGQVPGTQLLTVPSSMGLGVAAKRVRCDREQRERQERDSDTVCDVHGGITKESLQMDKAYHLVSADGKRVLRANGNKSERGLPWLQKFANNMNIQGYTLTFGEEDQQAPEASFSFSAGRTAGTHFLHSAAHGNNSLFFLGIFSPREWVVWDIPDLKGDWEELELIWGVNNGRGGEKTFKIKGDGGQFVKWEEDGDGGVFKSSGESTATNFALREAGG